MTTTEHAASTVASPGASADPGDDDVTATVAAFAAELRYEDVAAPVLHRIKLHLLDAIGCAVAGSDLDISRSARAVASRMGSGGASRVFGTQERFTPIAAAFANSVIANALDYDDGFEVNGKGMGHPSASLVPAALAALGRRPVCGRAFLVALAAAYEINNRLILAMQPSAARFRQVYGIGQHQAIGAALVFARLSGCDVAGIRNAIGLAGALTPLPSLHKYNWQSRPIISLKDGVAPAAQAGVQAAIMSEEGFVGSADLLDGPQGYWRMIGSDRFDASLVVDGLGTLWLAGKGSFKTYPACRWLAPALEAFENAYVKARLTPAAIAQVRVATFGIIADKLMERRPLNPIDAQFSLPHLIGAIATGRPSGPSWFSAGAFADEALREVADKVEVCVDPAMDRLMNGRMRRPSAAVEVVTTDGRRFASEVVAPLGGERRPVDDGVVLDKAARNLGGRGDAAGLIAAILAIENCDDVAGLFDECF
ncbi:MmgE/PrpD family protein [Ancylobacter sp. MQZ15Z-1]|uniref:MmgE/PrpD family protein n=1 Tax=Ancylobacter mangrovi TaxID=2972472 RepID=A0A9X2PIK8_9HYPH|nr:MmgE/PrpD family protein [Ancylobacter mangrovi]MCS0497776.1 MmgE/PrpD family protein [Ancylobacter mangrovi]